VKGLLVGESAGPIVTENTLKFEVNGGEIRELSTLIFNSSVRDLYLNGATCTITFSDHLGELIEEQDGQKRIEPHQFQLLSLPKTLDEGAIQTRPLEDCRYVLVPPWAKTAEVRAEGRFEHCKIELRRIAHNWLNDDYCLGKSIAKLCKKRRRFLKSICRKRNVRIRSENTKSSFRTVMNSPIESYNNVKSRIFSEFDWKSVLEEEGFDQYLSDLYERIGRNRSVSTSIAFIGSERLYLYLAAHFQVFLLEQTPSAEALISECGITCLVVETDLRTATNKQHPVLAGIDGRLSPECQEMIGAFKSCNLPIFAFVTTLADQLSLFRQLLEEADHLIVEDGDKALLEALKEQGLSKKTCPVPLYVERSVNSPLRTRRVRNTGVGFFNASDLFEFPHLVNSLRYLPPDATIISEFTYDFKPLALKKAVGLENYYLFPARTELMSLYVMQHTALLLVFEETLLHPNQQRKLIAKALASGVLPIYLGNSANLGELSPFVVEVVDAAELSEVLIQYRLDPIVREQAWLSRYRRFIRAHSFEHCVKVMASRLNESFAVADYTNPRVTMITVTKRPELLRSCLERFRRQIYHNKEIIVIVNCLISKYSLDAARTEHPNAEIQVIGKEINIGACLNLAIQHARGAYWFKFDDDDFYGPHYLEDLVNSFLYSRAVALGKPHFLTYLEGSDVTIARDNQNKERSRVFQGEYLCGATLAGKKSDLETAFSVRMRNGNDSLWVEELTTAGEPVIYADYLGFCVCRSTATHDHTWKLSDERLVSQGAGSRLIGRGFCIDRYCE
jgi:hypothetical protein